MELSEALLTFLVGGFVLLCGVFIWRTLPSRHDDRLGLQELTLGVVAFGLGFLAENLCNLAFKVTSIPTLAPMEAVHKMERQFELAWPDIARLFPDTAILLMKETPASTEPDPKAAWDYFQTHGKVAQALYYEAVNWGRARGQLAEVAWLHRRALFARTCSLSLLVLGLASLLASPFLKQRPKHMVLKASAVVIIGGAFVGAWYHEDVRFNLAVIGAFLSEVAQNPKDWKLSQSNMPEQQGGGGKVGGREEQAGQNASAGAELVLERAIAVTGPGEFQPSGLVIQGGTLYTVSDKDSTSVLAIDLDRGEAYAAVPILWTCGKAGDLDLEGIALDPEGTFLLVSEAAEAVLAVDRVGQASWIDINFSGPARAAGFLVTDGAGFEGVAHLGGSIIVAVERDPRGLVVEARGRVRALCMEKTIFSLPSDRHADFTDLTVYQGRLYAIVRNGDAIVELAPLGAAFEERRWWSFADAVAAYPYLDQRFGMAEGVAIDDQHIFVILDNNSSPLRDAPTDQRPMLFVFRRPADF